MINVTALPEVEQIEHLANGRHVSRCSAPSQIRKNSLPHFAPPKKPSGTGMKPCGRC
jgi:hypothetical protein